SKGSTSSGIPRRPGGIDLLTPGLHTGCVRVRITVVDAPLPDPPIGELVNFLGPDGVRYHVAATGRQPLVTVEEAFPITFVVKSAATTKSKPAETGLQRMRFDFRDRRETGMGERAISNI